MRRFNLILLALYLLLNGGAAHADVLCPDPEDALNVVPTDLAAVQDDIDRLSLCVKRTQLINQLNDLIEEQNKTDPLSGVTPPSFNHSDSFLAPLPSAPTHQENNVIDPAVLEKINVQDTPQKANAGQQIDDDVWYINRIWGSAGQLRAQLVFGGQAFVVSEGDMLVSGHVVESISYNSVTVRQGGDISDLTWYVAQ